MSKWLLTLFIFRWRALGKNLCNGVIWVGLAVHKILFVSLFIGGMNWILWGRLTFQLMKLWGTIPIPRAGIPQDFWFWIPSINNFLSWYWKPFLCVFKLQLIVWDHRVERLHQMYRVHMLYIEGRRCNIAGFCFAGLAAGVYSGLTYGLKEARGAHDWVRFLYFTILLMSVSQWTGKSLLLDIMGSSFDSKFYKNSQNSYWSPKHTIFTHTHRNIYIYI